MPDFDLRLVQAPDPFELDLIEIDRLYVEVTDPFGNVISSLPRRSGVSFTEPLNSVGMGTVGVYLKDEILQAYPTLLKEDNIIRFWLADKCVSGFRIKSRGLSLVSSDEEAGLILEVSGPTVTHMLKDIIVRHARTPRKDSPDTRAFNWTSPPGEWYNASNWVTGVEAWTLAAPPTTLKKNNPVEWPVPTAYWVTSHWQFFRKSFKTTAQMTVRIYATADEWFKCYLDGDLILEGTAIEIGYQTFTFIDTILPPGDHTISFATANIGTAEGDGADNFIFAMSKLDDKGLITTPPVLVSDKNWEHSTTNPPMGWTRAAVLRAAINEGKTRNVQSANILQLGFTATTDSEGFNWVDTFQEDVPIGTTALDLASALSEGNAFDFWVDPATLTLKAWKQRGEDKSASISLIPGVNLLDYSVEENDDVVNELFIQYDGGFTSVGNPSSQAKYGIRESFLTLGGISTEEDAVKVGTDIMRGLGELHKEAGTADFKNSVDDTPSGSISAAPGMVPMVHWETGDIITALDINYEKKRQRVMSLTCQEDSEGILSWDAELEEEALVVEPPVEFETIPPYTKPVTPTTPNTAQPYPAARKMGLIKFSNLREISGMEMSYTMPGHFWVHNDENEAQQLRLMKFDNGIALIVGSLGFSGPARVDPESISRHPDGRMFLADIGDNDNNRATVKLFAVKEPKTAKHWGVLPTEVYTMDYPASVGSKNAESLLIHPKTGELLIITKEATTGRAMSFGTNYSTSGTNVGTVVATGLPKNISDATFTRDGIYILLRRGDGSRFTTVYRFSDWKYMGYILDSGGAMTKSESICTDGRCSFLISEEVKSEAAGTPAEVWRTLIPAKFGAPCRVPTATPTSPTTPGNGTGGGSKDPVKPSQVLDLTNWKVTMPYGKSESPTEIKQPSLRTFEKAPYFYTFNGNRVIFQCPVNGVTTSGSDYPRSELRQMVNNGQSNAAWSNSSQQWQMEASLAFLTLPGKKPQVVAMQIHGGDDDVTVLRLEGKKLYITNGDNSNYKLIDSNYVLGTRLNMRVVAKKGGGIVWYRDNKVVATLGGTYSGCYFKAGCYTQANSGNGTGGGATVFYSLTVKRTA